MDSDSDFYISYSCPSVYKVDLTSFKDMLLNYIDIIGGVAFSGIETSFVEYVTSIVEPVGWKAVWRSTKDTSPLDAEYDFIAEVTNVSLQSLEADIFVKSIIVDDGITHNLDKLKEEINVENPRTVPLTELYVVSEDDYETQFEETAIAIEYVRIFFKTKLG
ncbi:SHC SH2 domain-binding protein 1 like protein [Argiope bruennichi]|uniref:SHC SH2 domain-binding protein 1 like protein n=1 Tax=Argiope bruennichi TaxID=94029 RepID=A0A8T0FZU1_ARGBR|nr:SHC SH2 domain-binding protein 1 like protein [Argiope bruennichi]